MVELRNVDYIMAVINTGSITKAARSLYISQPALSQSIKRLEKELGTDLLDRSNVPITLTYAGQRYIDAMKQVRTITTNLINDLSEVAGEAQGMMRLGISLQRSMQLLPLVLPEFTDKFPHVRLELEEHGSGTLEKMLHDGKCDVALITTSPRYEDLNYLLLETEEVLLMASKKTKLTERFPDNATISITDAQEEHFVSLKQGHSVRSIQDRLFAENQISPTILLETENLETAKRLASTANAVMLCPDVFIYQSPEVRRKVHCYHVQGLHYRRHFYMAHHKNMVFTRFMQEFLQITQKKLKEKHESYGISR